ncbi:cache domain-containing protein [Pseudarthrobacter sp. P1]|uniref:cache domain-containing protein n=1 Tax=Pseudarthrobacter sp. P1 TaxID=3418418 RepID=UPI003CF2493E
MSGSVAEAATQGVADLHDLVAGIERQLDDWAAATTAWITATGKLTGTAIDKSIRPAVQAMLAAEGSLLAGAGFVAATGALGPERSYIAWWQGEDLERVDALANFSPQSTSRYVKAEWFRVPVETGLPHVTGPYIDLLCTDEYVLTFTHPVFDGGTIAGIVGLDVLAQTLERLGMPLLRRIGTRAALVNADGRTIVATAPDIEAGDIVAPAAGATVHPVGRALRIFSDTVAL